MSGVPSNELALGPHVALVSAPTAGVPLFRRCPPTHTILLGRCRLEAEGRVCTTDAIALPANTPHHIVALEGPYASVAYLDPRRFRFSDAQALAEAWRGFVPGHDDLQEALGDALARPQRRVDPRVRRAIGLIETEDCSVAVTAARLDLSASRLTHLVSETLGAPPRAWKAWFKLVRAIQLALRGANLTQAAHLAGFADSAHLTRTCKQLTGVRPAKMIPGRVLVRPDLPLPPSP
ncbi:MAG: helix-turn-helix domain-containing protein [Nannocystaceae bacterium]